MPDDQLLSDNPMMMLEKNRVGKEKTHMFYLEGALLSFSGISHLNWFGAFFPLVEGGSLRERRSAHDSAGVGFGVCAMRTSILLFVQNQHSDIRRVERFPEQT